MTQASGGSPRPTPRAPLPRRVYVVRRLVVLVVPVLVLALVVWWLAGRGSSASADPRQTAASTSTSASTSTATKGATKGDDTKGEATQDETQDQSALGDGTTDDEAASALERAAQAAGVSVCRVDDLDVDVEAPATAFAGADKPAFRITVTSTLDDACLFEAGDANRRVTVTSGEDLVWSSTHCQGDDPESRPLLLGPGVPSEEVYTWPRVRSQKGCGSVQSTPRAGTYTATLRIDGEVVGKAVFDLR